MSLETWNLYWSIKNSRAIIWAEKNDDEKLGQEKTEKKNHHENEEKYSSNKGLIRTWNCWEALRSNTLSLKNKKK